MVFGKDKNNTETKTWAYRAAGTEIAFVFFPFVIYGVAHALQGSFFLSLILLSHQWPQRS